jgi:aconitate hydratase
MQLMESVWLSLLVKNQFTAGNTFDSLGLTGSESFTISGLTEGIAKGFSGGKTLTVTTDSGKSFAVTCRIDTPQEIEYYRHGGILLYVLRSLL